MKKNIIIIMALLTANIFAFGQKYDANYNQIKHTYVINDDGTVEFNYHKELKLNSLRSFFSTYGETFIVYNPAFQTLQINDSYTIRKDGSKIKTPSNAFVEQLPSSCTNCERYNGMREMVVVHTALEYGATIVLDYTITSNTKYFDEIIQLAETAPVSNYEVCVKVAGGQKLYYELKNSAVKPIKKMNTYTWKFKNLPQTSGEYYMPKNADVYPTLFLTTRNMKASDIDVKTSNMAAAKNTISSLEVKGDKMKTAEAIRNYVALYVHTNNVSMKLNNYKINPANKSFASNCANHVEKAVLLRDLLKQAGFLAELNVPIDMHKCDKEEFGIINEKDISVIANVGGNMYEFNPSNTAAPIKVDNKNADRSVNVVCRDMQWNEKDNKIEGKANTYLVNGEAKENNNVSFKLVNENNGYYTIHINDGNNGLNIDPAYLTSKRTQPLLCSKTNESYTYTIVLPKGVSYIGKENKITQTTAFGSMEIEIKTKGNIVEVSRKIKINKDIIKVAEYAQFRKMMIDWTNAAYTKLMFKKN
jgi:hypothetical protein